MIDFVIGDGQCGLRCELRVLVARHFRREDIEHVAVHLGKLSTLEVSGIIVAVNMYLGDFDAAALADLLIAPIEIGPAIINVDVNIHVHIYVSDVRDVDGMLDDVDIAPPFQETPATVIVARTEVADVHKRVIIGPDVTFLVHPGTNTHVDPAHRFRWQWSPAHAGTFRALAFPP